MYGKTRIKFKQGRLTAEGTGKWHNTTGYYIQFRVLFFIWLDFKGPYRHIQQAEKALREFKDHKL